MEYDARNNQTGLSFYDCDNKPVLHSELGHHKIEYEYNDRDECIRQAYFGSDLKPIVVDGLHELLREKDELGNTLREMYFGLNDKHIGKIEYVHNRSYKLLSKNYFDGSGRLIEQE